MRTSLEATAAQSPLYRTIVADPPWPVGAYHTPCWSGGGSEGRLPTPYPTMQLDEIRALPVAELADRDSDLYLWAINEFLVDAYDVVRGWGFAPSCLLTWCKPLRGVGLGGKFLSNTEFVLYATRRPPRVIDRRCEIARLLRDALIASGKSRSEIDAHFETKNVSGHWFTPDGYSARVPTLEQWVWLREWLDVGEGSILDEMVVGENGRKGERISPPLSRTYGRWFDWPRQQRHSAKPEAFLDMVEMVSPGPYLELFARRQRLGWDTWGDQAFNHVEVA